MSGSNDVDPLDEWLQREVQPLAPPSGAFDAISKRARRRKMGKLVAAASSAAAVAAVAVFVVPAVTSPRLPGSGNSSNVATGRYGSPTGTASPPAASHPVRSSTPAGTPSGSQPSVEAGGLSGLNLPPSFQPASVTFVSSTHGWVLGHSTTGGTTCGTGTCISIVQTATKGRTWTEAPAPPASISTPGTSTGVSSLRYLDGINGWAYGPDLWSTHDGGQTWNQVPTGGKVIIDLETSSGRAFAIFATCDSPSAASAITKYDRSCTGFTLESTPAGTDDWTPVGSATTNLTATASTSALLTLPSITFGGGTGWLLGPDGSLYSGSMTGGAWSWVSATPCPAPAAGGTASPSLLYQETGSTLLEACGFSEPGAGASGSAPGPGIYISANGGLTWQPQTTAPAPAAINSVAYTPSVPDIIASAGGLFIRPASTGQWTRIAGTPPGGFSFVGTTDATQGVAVPAGQLDYIWMTYDGGQTWLESRIGT
jgi:hypothetical protein